MTPGTRRPTLISVHLPKTAGTSLRLALEQVFGERLRVDYGDQPLQHSPMGRRAHALRQALATAGRRLPEQCIYGHFLPLKYALARATEFSIWIRDPVQRVISRYHHYLRAVEAGETVHERWGLVPGLDLAQFVRIPHYQDTLSHYLWAFDPRRFAFVGQVESWDEDFQRFFATFGLPAPEAPVANRNPGRDEAGYSPTAAERGLIETANLRDMRLHEILLRQREACGRERPAAGVKR